MKGKRYTLTECDLLKYMTPIEKDKWSEAWGVRLALWVGRKTRGNGLGRPPGLTKEENAAYSEAYRTTRTLAGRARMRMKVGSTWQARRYIERSGVRLPYCPPEWRERGIWAAPAVD